MMEQGIHAWINNKGYLIKDFNDTSWLVVAEEEKGDYLFLVTTWWNLHLFPKSQKGMPNIKISHRQIDYMQSL